MSISINDKDWILQAQTRNHWLGTGKVIATCWGSLSEVKKGCKKYKGENIQFYLTKCKKYCGDGYFYIARVLEGYEEEYGKLYIEEPENSAADDYLDSLHDNW